MSLRTLRSWRWPNPFWCRRPELSRPRQVFGRCERDAGRPSCGQEQIGCDTGQHVHPRGGDAGDTTNRIREAYRKKEFQLVSVDTLLNWDGIGTKAHTSERLTSLLRQMPLRLIEGQTKALTCLMLMDEEHSASHGGDGEGWDG